MKNYDATEQRHSSKDNLQISKHIVSVFDRSPLRKKLTIFGHRKLLESHAGCGQAAGICVAFHCFGDHFAIGTGGLHVRID